VRQPSFWCAEISAIEYNRDTDRVRRLSTYDTPVMHITATSCVISRPGGGAPVRPALSSPRADPEGLAQLRLPSLRGARVWTPRRRAIAHAATQLPPASRPASAQGPFCSSGLPAPASAPLTSRAPRTRRERLAHASGTAVRAESSHRSLVAERLAWPADPRAVGVAASGSGRPRSRTGRGELRWPASMVVVLHRSARAAEGEQPQGHARAAAATRLACRLTLARSVLAQGPGSRARRRRECTFAAGGDPS
jgi:hypothetical protein